MFLNNIGNHFKTICIHKAWVLYYCHKADITWQGIKHDLSKFSPTEFFESVKYYQGNRSPIDACKENKGYSNAWLHHKGRNKHHYEYWQDNFDKGGEALLMPYKYAIELVCDYLGAGRAYMKNDFTYEAEYHWWKQKTKNPIAMHPAIFNFVDIVLYMLTNKNFNDEDILREESKKIYMMCIKNYKEKKND